MPAVKVTSERDSTALIFQLKARTSGAKVLAAYAKQTLLDTEGARLCRAEDGSAVDLARPLLDQIADGELLTVTDAPAAAAAPEEEPEPRAEEAPEEEEPSPPPEPPSMDASFEQIAIPEPPMDAFLARELEELAVEREAAVAVVDAAEATALGAADAALALEVARAASEVALPCGPSCSRATRTASRRSTPSARPWARRSATATPILVVGGVGAGAVAVALGAERGAGEAVRVVAWPRGAVGAGCAAKLAKENGVDVEIYAGGGHEVDLVEGMPSEEGALGGVVLDVGDDGFVEPEALRRLAALTRAGLANAATPVAPRTVQVVGVLAARDSDACAGFDCSAFDRRLRCDLPRESLRATARLARGVAALRAADLVRGRDDRRRRGRRGRTVTVAEATTTVLGGVARGVLAAARLRRRRPAVAAAAVSCVLDNLGGEEARVAPRSPADDDGALDVEVDGVRVVSRHSSALYVEDDEYDVRDDDDASSDDDDAGPAHGRSALPRRADVLVSEIFGQALLEEGCVSTFVDATERLLTDDADVVPARGAIHATPVEWPARKGAGGVDYGSSSACTGPWARPTPTRPCSRRGRRRRRAAAAGLRLRLPLARGRAAGVCELVFTAQRDAVVTAIALHFDLDMDDAETYDSRTCDGWHWGRPVYVLPTPVRVAAGATLPVTLATNGDFQLHRVEKVRVALDAACAAKDLRHGRVAYASEDAANGLVGPMLAAKGRERADLKRASTRQRTGRAALCLAFVAEFRRLARTPNVAVDPIAVQDLP
ncbi:hypothetical protein JL720_15341 [Aureococcus anophagefferens]|nr:hypothetical protein JL720_15341 [Aureococcus anophagefferens]